MVMASGITTSRWIFCWAIGTGDLLFVPLLTALQRGKATLALLLVERVDDGQPPAHPLLAAARRRRTLLVAQIGRAGGLFLFLEVLAGRRFLGLLLGLGLALVPLFPRLHHFHGLFRNGWYLGDKLCHNRLLGFQPLFLGLPLARLDERARAQVLLLVGELLQHDAGAALGLFLLRLDLGHRRALQLRGLLRLLERLVRPADHAALLLLDDDGLRAAMAEALPHMAGLHGPAHVQRHLLPAASGLFFSFGVCFAHSVSVSFTSGANAALPLR